MGWMADLLEQSGPCPSELGPRREGTSLFQLQQDLRDLFDRREKSLTTLIRKLATLRSLIATDQVVRGLMAESLRSGNSEGCGKQLKLLEEIYFEVARQEGSDLVARHLFEEHREQVLNTIAAPSNGTPQ